SASAPARQSSASATIVSRATIRSSSCSSSCCCSRRCCSCRSAPIAIRKAAKASHRRCLPPPPGEFGTRHRSSRNQRPKLRFLRERPFVSSRGASDAKRLCLRRHGRVTDRRACRKLRAGRSTQLHVTERRRQPFGGNRRDQGLTDRSNAGRCVRGQNGPTRREEWRQRRGEGVRQDARHRSHQGRRSSESYGETGWRHAERRAEQRG